MFSATLQIVGTLATLFLLMTVSGTISEKRSNKRFQDVLSQASIQFDIPFDELISGKYNKELTQFLLERYDNDRIQNRISDIFRPLLVILEMASYISQLGFIGFIAFKTYTVDPDIGVYSWFSIAIALFFLIIIMLLSFICNLLTARGPGEARDGRAKIKDLANK